jgi:hypothetical protein
MTQFQSRTQPLVQKVKNKSSNERKKEENSSSSSNDEPATARVAEKVYSAVRHAELPEEKKDQAGQLVHYGFGTLMGMSFGALATVLPKRPIARGLLFGSLVWLLADEIGVPASKLSPPPWKVNGATHAYGWISHLVYGAALSGLFKAEEAIAA